MKLLIISLIFTFSMSAFGQAKYKCYKSSSNKWKVVKIKTDDVAVGWSGDDCYNASSRSKAKKICKEKTKSESMYVCIKTSYKVRKVNKDYDCKKDCEKFSEKKKAKTFCKELKKKGTKWYCEITDKGRVKFRKHKTSDPSKTEYKGRKLFSSKKEAKKDPSCKRVKPIKCKACVLTSSDKKKIISYKVANGASCSAVDKIKGSKASKIKEILYGAKKKDFDKKKAKELCGKVKPVKCKACVMTSSGKKKIMSYKVEAGKSCDSIDSIQGKKASKIKEILYGSSKKDFDKKKAKELCGKVKPVKCKACVMTSSGKKKIMSYKVEAGKSCDSIDSIQGKKASKIKEILYGSSKKDFDKKKAKELCSDAKKFVCVRKKGKSRVKAIKASKAEAAKKSGKYDVVGTTEHDTKKLAKNDESCKPVVSDRSCFFCDTSSGEYVEVNAKYVEQVGGKVKRWNKIVNKGVSCGDITRGQTKKILTRGAYLELERFLNDSKKYYKKGLLKNLTNQGKKIFKKVIKVPLFNTEAEARNHYENLAIEGNKCAPVIVVKKSCSEILGNIKHGSSKNSAYSITGSFENSTDATASVKSHFGSFSNSVSVEVKANGSDSGVVYGTYIGEDGTKCIAKTTYKKSVKSCDELKRNEPKYKGENKKLEKFSELITFLNNYVQKNESYYQELKDHYVGYNVTQSGNGYQKRVYKMSAPNSNSCEAIVDNEVDYLVKTTLTPGWKVIDIEACDTEDVTKTIANNKSNWRDIGSAGGVVIINVTLNGNGKLDCKFKKVNGFEMIEGENTRDYKPGGKAKDYQVN